MVMDLVVVDLVLVVVLDGCGGGNSGSRSEERRVGKEC